MNPYDGKEGERADKTSFISDMLYFLRIVSFIIPFLFYLYYFPRLDPRLQQLIPMIIAGIYSGIIGLLIIYKKGEGLKKFLRKIWEPIYFSIIFRERGQNRSKRRRVYSNRHPMPKAVGSVSNNAGSAKSFKNGQINIRIGFHGTGPVYRGGLDKNISKPAVSSINGRSALPVKYGPFYDNEYSFLEKRVLEVTPKFFKTSRKYRNPPPFIPVYKLSELLEDLSNPRNCLTCRYSEILFIGDRMLLNCRKMTEKGFYIFHFWERSCWQPDAEWKLHYSHFPEKDNHYGNLKTEISFKVDEKNNLYVVL